MEDNLEFIQVKRKRGDELFHRNGKSIGSNVQSFWQWSASDLLDNTERGILAEYIVALDLGITETVRGPWDAFDLRSKEGIRIEVKSAAYIQRWKQPNYSVIAFDIKPTYAWDKITGKSDRDKRRQADVYIFCLLTNKAKKSVDPLDVGQWEFYLLPTSVLDKMVGNQKSIRLKPLIRLGAARAEFGQIGATLRALCLK